MPKRKRISYLKDGEPVPSGEPRRYPSSRGYIRLRWSVGPWEEVEAWEHRLVAGAKTGQHVHHKNGIKHDNRPENLELLTIQEHGTLHADEKRMDDGLVIEMYEQGMTMPQIADILGCNNGTVSRVLQRNGVKARSSSDYRRKVDTDLIREMHSQGASGRRIARELGVSSVLVRARMAEMGLQPNRPGRQPKNIERRWA